MKKSDIKMSADPTAMPVADCTVIPECACADTGPVVGDIDGDVEDVVLAEALSDIVAPVLDFEVDVG